MNGSSLKPRWVDRFDSQCLSATCAPPLAAEGRPCTAQHTSGTTHPAMSEPAFDRDEEVAGLAEGATWGTRLASGRREVDDSGKVASTFCVAAAIWIGVVGCASPCTSARLPGAWWRPAASSGGPSGTRARCSSPTTSWQVLHDMTHRIVESCSVRAPPPAERGAGRFFETMPVASDQATIGRPTHAIKAPRGGASCAASSPADSAAGSCRWTHRPRARPCSA